MVISNPKVRLFKVVLLVLLMVFKLELLADAKKLLIAITSQYAPYTVDHIAKSGIDPELLDAVFARMGYEVEFLPIPSVRSDSYVSRQDVDGGTGWFNDFVPGCHKARPYRYWYNALIVPQDSIIKTTKGLAGKRILVFEGADKFVDGYRALTSETSFITIADSSLQAGRMTRAGRVEAFIGDYIGYYYSLVDKYDHEEARRLTNVIKYFNVNPQKICFKDINIRDKFDSTLDEMIEEGIFETIYTKYAPDIDKSLFPTRDRMLPADENKKILIAISSQTAPYTIDLYNNVGIDPEIISTVLGKMGHKVEFMPIPNSRQDIIQDVDSIGAVTGWTTKDRPECHETKAFRYWYNALIVSQDSSITSVEELKNKRVLTFDGAHDYVNGFAKIAIDADSIDTVNDSFQAGRLIRAGRVDAYIGDYPSYFFHLVEKYGSAEARRLTKVIKFFNVNKQRICFREQGIRDKFDQTLDQLIEENFFHEIYTKYSPNILPSLYPTKRR